LNEIEISQVEKGDLLPDATPLHIGVAGIQPPSPLVEVATTAGDKKIGERIDLVSDMPLLSAKEPIEKSSKVAPKENLHNTKGAASAVQTLTPRRSTRAKPSSISTAAVPPSRSSRLSSSALSTPLSSIPPSLPSPITNSSPSTVAAIKSTKKHKSNVAQNEPASTRTSKRKPASTRDSSVDPLSGPITTSAAVNDRGIFFNMAFAVSYVKQLKEKDNISKKISAHGGQILEEGFEVLFEPLTLRNHGTDLSLSSVAESIGFVALIADEHSRKAKYIEALALGLPCLSGRWVEACVAKGQVISWGPYLLCAGHSSFLNAIPSRTLQPYPAADAKFTDIFASRNKMLQGKSAILVTGRGQTADARKAYVFLTRILGPSQLLQVVDYESARKKLIELEQQKRLCDLIFVDNEKAASASIFAPISGSKSRKRKSNAADIDSSAPKRIRIVNDEIIVQSLIMGQFLEERL